MESINSELEVIRLIEEELNYRNEDEFKHRLKRLKNLAHCIEREINKEESGYNVYKATNILCKYLGILWKNVFNIKY